ncbi:MAG: hypothetical protein GF403_06690 [Candidatus Coatesbacteria bacterium]|nr:hypothetical protein [Candidatus Coatesbacteria bacterium]
MPAIWVDGYYKPAAVALNAAINQRKNKNAPLMIEFTGNITGSDGFLDASIRWTDPYDGDTDHLKVFFAIAENDLNAGGRHYNYTMRDLLPTGQGQVFPYGSPGDREDYHIEFDVDTVWKTDDLLAYVWVQDTTNDSEGRKEVLQMARVDLDEWESRVVETSWGSIKAQEQN